MNAWNSLGRNARRACLVTGRAFCPILCRFQRWRHNFNSRSCASLPGQTELMGNWLYLVTFGLLTASPPIWMTHSLLSSLTQTSAHSPGATQETTVSPRDGRKLSSWFLLSLKSLSTLCDRQTDDNIGPNKSRAPQKLSTVHGPHRHPLLPWISQWSWWSLLIDNLT